MKQTFSLKGRLVKATLADAVLSERVLQKGEGGDGDGEGGGAVIYFFGHHPVSSGGQGSLFVNTPLPGSPGGRRKEQGGEGMKEQNSGVQIPAGIL